LHGLPLEPNREQDERRTDFVLARIGLVPGQKAERGEEGRNAVVGLGLGRGASQSEEVAGQFLVGELREEGILLKLRRLETPLGQFGGRNRRSGRS
jgi:hypothetical protein